MRKVTTQGRHWKPEPCNCREFLLEHPRAEQHQGHIATGLETLDFNKGQTNLGVAFHNVGACNAIFLSKQRLREKVVEQLRRWLKHHLFPNDARILEDFEVFFEGQWRQHKEEQIRQPRLTHRLVKHLLSALPDNYIIHNEDHANAHLMIYCPNIYNQAAFNTWMDKKTFLLLDKAPEDIKEEVHELFLANEDKPERELIFLNHDLVGFFNSIPQADIIQSVRYLIVEFTKNNNDIILIDPYRKLNPVHSGTSTHSIKSNMTKLNVQHIVDIIQFSFDACAFTAIGEVFRQTCGTSMGNQISPILSTCAIVVTEITWLRLFGQHVASAHLADQLWIRRYVDNRAIIVDKDVLHSNPHIWQLASLHFYKKARAAGRRRLRRLPRLLHQRQQQTSQLQPAPSSLALQVASISRLLETSSQWVPQQTTYD